MIRCNVTIKWEIGADESTIRNQAVTDILIDAETGFAFGTWRGHRVGAFHLEGGIWHVL